MKAASVRANCDRQNSIGFLRFMLAVLVIYTHCYRLGGFNFDEEWLWKLTRHTVEFGVLSVQSFFVLSGALIAASWNRNSSLLSFLWCRFLRLAPALWVCLAATAFIFTPLLYFSTSDPRTPFFDLEPSAAGYIWHNLYLPRTQVGIDIFPNGGPWAGDWNGSLWTLFYEGSCYLMIAALGLLGLLNRYRWFGGAALGGFIALFSVWTAFHPSWLPVRVDRLFDTIGKQMTLFFFAGTLWAIFPEIGATFIRHRWLGPATAALLVTGWSLGIHTPIAIWLLPATLFWIARELPLAEFERRIGGDYSYGLYVYGYPVQQVLAHFRIHEIGFGTYLVVSLAVTGACAMVSWHFIERRALGWKSLVASRAEPADHAPSPA